MLRERNHPPPFTPRHARYHNCKCAHRRATQFPFSGSVLEIRVCGPEEKQTVLDGCSLHLLTVYGKKGFGDLNFIQAMCIAFLRYQWFEQTWSAECSAMFCRMLSDVLQNAQPFSVGCSTIFCRMLSHFLQIAQSFFAECSDIFCRLLDNPLQNGWTSSADCSIIFCRLLNHPL